MLKTITTYIAGVNYNNEDGSCRKDILSELIFDSDLLLENYMFENEKAVRLLTYQKRCVGNIPKDLAQEIYEFNAKGKVKAVVYKPQFYNNGSINHQIKIYIKTLLNSKR